MEYCSTTNMYQVFIFVTMANVTKFKIPKVSHFPPSNELFGGSSRYVINEIMMSKIVYRYTDMYILK